MLSSSETSRTRLLQELKYEISLYIDSVKESWKDCGCSLMSNGWKDNRRRPYINLLSASPKDILFLKSTCGIDPVKDGQYLFDYLINHREDRLSKCGTIYF